MPSFLFWIWKSSSFSTCMITMGLFRWWGAASFCCNTLYATKYRAASDTKARATTALLRNSICSYISVHPSIQIICAHSHSCTTKSIRIPLGLQLQPEILLLALRDVPFHIQSFGHKGTKIETFRIILLGFGVKRSTMATQPQPQQSKQTVMGCGH